MAKIDEPATGKSTLAAVEAATARLCESQPAERLAPADLAHDCARRLWYKFRWAETTPHKSGQACRRITRQRAEVDRMAHMLELAGLELRLGGPNSEPFDLVDADFGAHVGGKIHGVAVGVPEAPKTWHLLDIRGLNDKDFKLLCRHGVQEARAQAFAAMQVFMAFGNLERAMYCAANKNDDALYFERIAHVPDISAALIAKGRSIVGADSPPPKLNDDPKYFVCAMCEFSELCHGRYVEEPGETVDKETGEVMPAPLNSRGPEALPAVNCRTCLHATPECGDGRGAWSCARWACDIPLENQLTGCDEHLYIPALIPWAVCVDSDGMDRVFYEIPGEGAGAFANGPKDVKNGLCLPSHELRALHPAMLSDANLAKIMQTFDASAVMTDEQKLVWKYLHSDDYDADVPF